MEKDPKSYIPKYDEQMPKEEMLEQINKEYRALPDRKSLKYDEEILGNYKFSNEEKEPDLENMTELDLSKKIPTESIFF